MHQTVASQGETGTQGATGTQGTQGTQGPDASAVASQGETGTQEHKVQMHLVLKELREHKV